MPASLITRAQRLTSSAVILRNSSGVLGAGSIALALWAGWMTLRFSAGAARIGMRALLMALLFLFLFRGERLPEIPLYGVELSIALSALMIILLRREVHPR